MSGADLRRAQDPSVGLGVIRFLKTIVRNRALVRELTTRDLTGGHAGHGFGAIWVYIQPLVVVATYILVFGLVLGTRMAATETFPGDYTAYILAGLVPWLIMANALGRAPSVFLSSSNLVKQVVFPVEVLPVASIAACFLIFVPSVAIAVGYKLVLGGGLTPYVLMLPAVLALHALFALGLTLLFSVVTPFVRDIREIVTVYTSVSMYFTPAIYLPEWVPPAIRPLMYMNPFSYVVWVYQDVLFFGRVEHGFAWIVFAVMAIGTAICGLAIFRKVKPFLGNVL